MNRDPWLCRLRNVLYARFPVIYGVNVIETTLDYAGAMAGPYRRSIFEFPPMQLKSEDDLISLAFESAS
jgi:hypothetical protein